MTSISTSSTSDRYGRHRCRKGPTGSLAWSNVTHVHNLQQRILKAAGPCVQVTSVDAGNGMLYARTRKGYTFAWGCGSQGQLGVGGSTKGNPRPQRMPGAHQITQITGARGGHFGAAVDTQGRVLTFGAGGFWACLSFSSMFNVMCPGLRTAAWQALLSIGLGSKLWCARG